jgi:hypothetical protein
MSEYYDHEHERYPMSEENTCCCGLYVHPKRRNPSAIHIKDCPYHPDNDPGISSDKPLLPPWTEVELQRCYLAKDYWKRKRIYFDTREEALKYRDEQPYKHSSSLRKMVREILFIFPATDKGSRRYYNKRGKINR